MCKKPSCTFYKDALGNTGIEEGEIRGTHGRKERGIDAYCGIETIGMVAAKQEKHVLGIELNKDAIGCTDGAEESCVCIL